MAFPLLDMTSAGTSALFGANVFHTLGIYVPLVIGNLVVFLVFFAIMRKLLFERVRGHMNERNAALEADRGAAAGKEADRDAKISELEASEAALEKEAYELTQAQVKSGVERKTASVQAAQATALKNLTKVREQCAASQVEVLASGGAVLHQLTLDLVGLASFGEIGGKRLDQAVSKGIKNAVGG